MSEATHRRIRTIAAAAAIAALAVLPEPARAFHAGGVGDCDGCHTMHDSSGGAGDRRAAAYLLQGADPSSRCLDCHATARQGRDSVLSTQVGWGQPPANFTPGGDFAWLKKSFTWVVAQKQQTSPGERHGHNVIASDFGLERDRTRTTAPGGTYPSDKLSCISCHDPHGRYRVLDTAGTVGTSGKPIAASGSLGDLGGFAQPTGRTAVGSYRLLGGVGYAPRSAGAVPPFAAPAPTALAPSVYNQGESFADVRVVYGAGMSEWCGNCHGRLHTPAGAKGGITHPSGPTARLVDGRHDSIYNAYAKGGDLGGTWLTSYTSLVPYEEGTTDRLQLSDRARSDGTARSGPRTGLENVMCLSCHRAHASGWDHALRWNQRSEFVVVGGQWPGIDSVGDAGKPAFAQGRMQAETRAAMYDRPPTAFSSFQTSLCNKCHAK